MTVITDTVIEEILTVDEQEWEKNPEKLLITNFSNDCLTPVGYDLRVGSEIIKVNLRSGDTDRLDLEKEEEFKILPQEMVAIKTEEKIGMPKNKKYSGIIVSKVSLAEKGLSHISTSLDADWSGELVVTFFNHTFRTITLKRGQPFCTMILLKNEKPPKRPCGKSPEGHLEKLYREWTTARKEYQKARKMRITRLLAGIPFVVSWGLLVIYHKVEVVMTAIAYSAMYLYYIRNILKDVSKKINF